MELKDLIRGLIEAAVPLVAGSVLTFKLIRNRGNKLFYLGPVLLAFAVLLVIKSLVQAEDEVHPDWVAPEIAIKLKGGRQFPVQVDPFTTLEDIRATGNHEISYFYSVLLEDKLDRDAIVDYSCKSKDFALLFEKQFELVFVYSGPSKREFGRVKVIGKDCKSE